MAARREANTNCSNPYGMTSLSIGTVLSASSKPCRDSMRKENNCLPFAKPQDCATTKPPIGGFVFSCCGGGVGHEMRTNCSEHSQLISHSRPRLGIARELAIYLHPAIPAARHADASLPSQQ